MRSTRVGPRPGRRRGAPVSEWRSSAQARQASPLPDQLNRAGHLVTVLERADRIGGLLRYGIPALKAEKRLLDRRRLSLLSEEGVTFRTSCEIGVDVPVDELRAGFARAGWRHHSTARLVSQYRYGSA